MRKVVLLLAALTACAPPQEGCGLIGCVSSPYLRARGNAGLVGASLASVIAFFGEAPSSSVDIGNGQRVMTWTRSQSDRDMGFLSCSETITVGADRVTGYSRRGNCGGGN